MTRTNRFRALPALALLAGLAACAGGEAPEGEQMEGAAANGAGSAAPVDVPPPPRSSMSAAEEPDAPRPEEKTGTIAVAGETAELAFKRFEAPADFPLQFSTYVPEDMIVETVKAGKADGVRVISNFTGKRNESAYIWVLFQPPGTTEEDARESFQKVAAARKVGEELPERERRFPWALSEYEFRYQPSGSAWYSGRLALGRRGDRWFHLVVQYRDDMAAEFVPRANRILEDWRWKGSGGRIGDARR